jgi:hypothetical protein
MRKQLACVSLIMCMALSGCGASDGLLERQMRKKSGLEANESYRLYQVQLAENKIDSQGYIREEYLDEDEDESRPEGSARVTFSANSYLEIEYFLDADLSKPIIESTCYLYPGDSVYARVSVENANSSMYEFSAFRIYQYDGQKRKRVASVEDGLVLEITEQQAGAELAVEPIGRYKPRGISLRDYYTDESGKEHDLSGVWTIDGREETGYKTEISPISSYVISYKYDSDEYFYLSSDPQCYYVNNEDGIAIFEKRDPRDDTADYAVELHKYITVAIPIEQSREVSVNGGSPQEMKLGQNMGIPRLKYGDTVEITTNKEWSALESCRELILQSEESHTSGEYKYTMVVPQKGGEFVFDPTEYSYEHGQILFKCFGEVVTGIQYLAVGSKITYEPDPDNVDEGYWLASGGGVIVVGDEAATKQKLNDIRFVPRVQVTVELPQPKHGGKIKYFADGKEVTELSYQTTSGSKIAVEFFPWEGWILRPDFVGKVYEATEEKRQVVFGIEGLNTVFSEDPAHMPLLEVVLDKSVGEQMQFTFAAPGLNKSTYQFENKWNTFGSYTVIKPTAIGTEYEIAFSMGNRAIPTGKAVKVLVEKADTGNNKTAEYRLISDLTKLQEPIAIYEKSELGISKIWYKSVKITVSLVDVMTFSAPHAPNNAIVTVRNDSTMKMLRSGELVESSEKVTVNIRPNPGYYVSGKGVKSDAYQDSMKFSKYGSDIQKIVDEHPVKRYYSITLDSADEYGECVYKLNGNIASGSIRVKEKQKLTLDYKIIKPGYSIEGAKGIMWNIGKNDQKKTESLEITASLDGKTINRDTFGIRVVKGG